MTSLEKLDKIIEEQLKKVVVPAGMEANFAGSCRPGDGHFYVKGKINDAVFEYRIESRDRLYLKLQNDEDVICVHAEEGQVQDVEVNDRYHHNPELPYFKREREPWQKPTEYEQESAKAVEFATSAICKVQEYLKSSMPLFMQLVKGYFSRALLPGDDRPSIRSNSEIFEQFNLNLRKINKPALGKREYGREKA